VVQQMRLLPLAQKPLLKYWLVISWRFSSVIITEEY
jgi:hypothetical protein